MRTFGRVEPISLLEKLFSEVDPDELSRNDWKKLLLLSADSAEHLPDRYKTADMCATACNKKASSIKFFPPPIRSSFLHQLVASNQDVYKHLKDEERTVELTRMVLSCDPFNIEEVPKKLLEQHPDLLDLVTEDVTPHCLNKIPKSLLTAEFALRFAHPRYPADALFELLPQTLKTDSAFLLAYCAGNGASLKFIPSSLVDETVCKAAINKSPFAIEHVPKTAPYYRDLCWQAIRMDGRAIAFINPDEEFADYNFYLEACRHIQSAKSPKNYEHILNSVPQPFRTEELCRLLITTAKNVEVYLHLLPESMRHDPKVCLEAVESHGFNFKHVPQKLKTEALCLTALVNAPANINHIPEELSTASLIEQVIKIRAIIGSPTLILLPSEKITFDHCQLALRGGKRENIEQAVDTYHKLTSELSCEPLISEGVLGGLYLEDMLCLLSHPKLDLQSQRRIIEYLTTDSRPLTSAAPVADADKLYETVNPLVWSDFNPILPELVYASYQCRNFAPPLQREGRDLLDFVSQQGTGSLYPMPTSEPLQCADDIELVGGRTLRLTANGETLYYKFQRKGEPLSDLMGEGFTHHYMQNIKPTIGQLLKSDMPRNPVFFVFPAEQLAELPAFRDELKITQEDMGQEWIAVYRYSATPSYGAFAHQLDHCSENRTEKPELGLLKACHDMGVFTALGLIPTSTLPAFHDTGSQRRWMPLHSVLGYTPNCAFSGTFGAWNTVATEYPDFGYSGFRDVFDVEPFGEILSYSKNSDTKPHCHPLDVQQRLMLANACIENLLAAILVRSRLQQQLPCYHYKNPVALAQGCRFVESALSEFINGYFCGTGSDLAAPPHTLQNLMQLDDTDYHNWLHRTVVEIIYWTAAQPEQTSPDQPAFIESEFDHADCYALHLRQTNQLSPELYQNSVYSEKKYPEDFHNIENRLNLGGSNRLFPMTSLIKGLTRIAANLLKERK